MESQATASTATPAQTRAIGAGIAPLLGAGDVVLLVGPLGAGKTTLVQGLVAALGGREPVTSPTFTLAHRYPTSPPVVDLALEEELDGGGVVIVEWGEAAEPLYGADALVVRLGWGRTDDERTIAVEARGASWISRAAGLSAVAGAGAGTPGEAAVGEG